MSGYEESVLKLKRKIEREVGEGVVSVRSALLCQDLEDLWQVAVAKSEGFDLEVLAAIEDIRSACVGFSDEGFSVTLTIKEPHYYDAVETSREAIERIQSWMETGDDTECIREAYDDAIAGFQEPDIFSLHLDGDIEAYANRIASHIRNQCDLEGQYPVFWVNVDWED